MTSAILGVRFDLFGSGRVQTISWTANGTDDAWLALDRNGNGRIDNGTELFGNVTPLVAGGRASNGFEALAEYDQPALGGNGDHMITAQDAIYSRLLLWQDINHNGQSEPNELLSLPQAGVTGLDLRYQTHGFVDEYGNRFRYRAKVLRQHGSDVARWAYDVFLLPAPTNHSGTTAARTPTRKIGERELLANHPPTIGPTNAPITIAVFSDFQCPYCAMAAERLSRIRGIHSEEVRIVYKYYPLPSHSWARTAAKAAACVHAQRATESDEVFWRLHDYYFKRQGEITPTNVESKTLDLLRTIPGFGIAEYQGCLQKSAATTIEKDLALGNELKIRGTPTFFVNGQPATSVEDMERMIVALRSVTSRAGKPDHSLSGRRLVGGLL